MIENEKIEEMACTFALGFCRLSRSQAEIENREEFPLTAGALPSASSSESSGSP